MKQETLQLTGGAGKEKRRELDYYPTPKSATIALLDFIKDQGLMLSMRGQSPRALEPCCGEGAISKVLQDYGYFVESHDIVFTEFAGEGIDYFSQSFKADIIVTNPPFNLSEAFIKKALLEADVVCMLLKSQYWHAAKRIDLFESHRPAFVLPLTWRLDFLEHERYDGKKGSPTMEVAWSVWYKGSAGTDYILLKKP